VDECKPLPERRARLESGLLLPSVPPTTMGLHSCTSQLNLNRVGHTSPYPPV